MKAKDIVKIEVVSRGKNRDYYGNVYIAFHVTIYVGNGLYPYTRLFHSMSAGDNYADYCRNEAVRMIRNLFGWEYSKTRFLDELAVTKSHTTVYTDSALEEPWNWRS